MFYTIDNKIATAGGKVARANLTTLNFTVRGPSFMNHYASPTDPYANAAPNSYMLIYSSGPNKISINYGDGTIDEYDFLNNGGNYGIAFSGQIGQSVNVAIPAGALRTFAADKNHIFTDGNTTNDRTVSISFSNPNTITDLYMHYFHLRGDFPSDIYLLKGLQRLSLVFSSHLQAFPTTMSKLRNLQNMAMLGVTQTNLLEWPEGWVGLSSLNTINIQGSMDLSNSITSHIDRIGSYGSQLVNLNLSVNIDDELPTTWAQLTSVVSLGLNGNALTSIPLRINQMPAVSSIGLSANQLTSWGDLTGKTNLISLNVSSNSNIAPVPAWLSTLTALKSLDVRNSYLTVARVNQFVDDMYSIVTANASMIGASILPFRGMNIPTWDSGTTQKRPSGTYQQPSGYAHGVSNGTPASQMEKVWVMNNQYGHTWTVAP